MFGRTRADGVWLGAGFVPDAADWQDLSTKVFRAVNGYRGGTWAPKSALFFPDGGLEVAAPTLVAHGGEVEMAAIDFEGVDQWPKFAPGHALRRRTILQSLVSMRSPKRHWRLSANDASIMTSAIGFLRTGASAVETPGRASMDIEVHDRATLKSATFTFRVPIQRRSAPFGMPRFRIVQVDRNGRAVPLASPAAGADEEGWQSPPKVTSAIAWFNGGTPQTFTYVCDQNNHVDVSLYRYVAEIEEEDVDPYARLATTLNITNDAIAIREMRDDVELATTETLSAASLSGSLIIDGVPTSPGWRVLVKHGINNNEAGTRYLNGVWVTGSGAWARASDVSVVDNVSRSFFVHVRHGVVNKGTAWQLAQPYPTAISSSSSLNGTADIYFEPFELLGNKYHSVALHFDDITEMRWQ